MPAKPFPVNVVEQAQMILDAINQINADMTIGTVTDAAISADITQAAQLASEMNALEAQMTNVRNQRDALYTGLWDKIKRVRSGMKGNYGDDTGI